MDVMPGNLSKPDSKIRLYQRNLHFAPDIEYFEIPAWVLPSEESLLAKRDIDNVMRIEKRDKRNWDRFRLGRDFGTDEYKNITHINFMLNSGSYGKSDRPHHLLRSGLGLIFKFWKVDYISNFKKILFVAVNDGAPEHGLVDLEKYCV